MCSWGRSRTRPANGPWVSTLVKPDIEKAIFLKSFDIMESYRKNEEVHAPGGWQICVLFHQAQVLQHGSSVQGKTDPVTDLCNFFKGYEFAASSDYTRLDKKLAKECLTVYDRVMASPTSEEILIQARVHLGPKTTSKLIMISQRTAACLAIADTKKTSLVDIAKALEFVLGYMYVRMRTSVIEADMAIRTLKSAEVPSAVMACTLVKFILSKYTYANLHEQEMLAPSVCPQVVH